VILIECDDEVPDAPSYQSTHQAAANKIHTIDLVDGDVGGSGQDIIRTISGNSLPAGFGGVRRVLGATPSLPSPSLGPADPGNIRLEENKDILLPASNENLSRSPVLGALLEGQQIADIVRSISGDQPVLDFTRQTSNNSMPELPHARDLGFYRQISNKSMPDLPKFSISSKRQGFPKLPPGNLSAGRQAVGSSNTLSWGKQAKEARGVDGLFNDARNSSSLDAAKRGQQNLHANAFTDPGPVKTPGQQGGVPAFSTGGDPMGPWKSESTDSLHSESQLKSGFLHSESQLKSVEPLTQEELDLASRLNALIYAESKDADLVVTNLPDMPTGESAFGYCELVEEISKGLKRCLLVRGSAAEVITAFT